MIMTVKKRARSKKDAILTTYITSDGKVKVKRSLGYNAKLKSRLVLMFECMLKSKNEFYIGSKEDHTGIYWGYRHRLSELFRMQGLDPEEKKNIIHLRARRRTIQLFVEQLWIWARKFLGYPTNGGTYYEAKLHGKHLQGLDPAFSE